MDAEQARRAGAVMRAAGVPGVVAPADPGDPDGEWRVYDTADPAARTETTAEALAAVVAAFRDAPPSLTPEPFAADRPAGPLRGFIFPPKKGS
jgi:hypothetical protein